VAGIEDEALNACLYRACRDAQGRPFDAPDACSGQAFQQSRFPSLHYLRKSAFICGSFFCGYSGFGFAVLARDH
jgi:hypothetical protein